MKWTMPPNTEDVEESFSSTVWEFPQLSKNQVYFLKEKQMRSKKSKGTNTTLLFMLVIAVFYFAGFQTAKEAKATTIKVWDWHSTEVPDTMKAIYEGFEEKHGIHVEVQALSWDDIHSKIPIAAVAGQLPDVVQMNANFLLSSLVSRGSLASLDDYIQQEGGQSFLSKFKPNSVLREDGSIYSMPILLWKHDLLYNPNLFGALQPPTNWNELEQTAKALTDKNKGIFGFAIPGACGETILYFSNFVAQNGGTIGLAPGSVGVPDKVTSADIGVNDPKAVEAIEFALKLVQNYGPPFAGAGCKQIRDLYTAGNIAMYYEGADAIVFMWREGMTFEMGTASMPIGPIGKPAAVNDYGNAQFAISANSPNKDAAWKFLQYVTSEKVQVQFAKGTAMVAAVTGSPDKELLSDHPRMRPAIDSLKAKEPDWYVMDAYRNLPPQTQEATDIFNAEIQKAALGQKTVQAAMDDVARQWTELWAAWGK